MAKRKALRWFLLSAIALLVVAVAGGTLFVRRIQSNAQHWAETGKGAINLFKKCKAGLAASDPAGRDRGGGHRPARGGMGSTNGNSDDIPANVNLECAGRVSAAVQAETPTALFQSTCRWALKKWCRHPVASTLHRAEGSGARLRRTSRHGAQRVLPYHRMKIDCRSLQMTRSYVENVEPGFSLS